MRRDRLRGPARQKQLMTSDSSHILLVAERLLKRQLSSAAPDLTWVSVIPAIATRKG